ncbi:hypothetical protein MTO96_031106, partial [Rhipicephalus appendiculatus]
MEQWIQRYGKIFGIYLGDKPTFIITDVELVKECFIKTTKAFQDRPMYAVEVEPILSGLLFLRGEKWRKVRSVFNACFTAGKVKKLYPIIDGAVMRLVQKFDDASRFGDIIDAHEATRCMVLETLTSTVLGREVDNQMSSNEATLKSLEVIFREVDNAVFESTFAYPGLYAILQRHLVSTQPLPPSPFLLYLLAKHPDEQVKIREEIASVLRAKEVSDHGGLSATECTTTTSSAAKQDLESDRIQLNGNARSSSTPHVPNDMASGNVNWMSETRQGENNELIDVLTSAETFSHPQRARSELDEDDVMQLQRLDMVVREGLRLYPAVPINVMRECM